MRRQPSSSLAGVGAHLVLVAVGAFVVFAVFVGRASAMTVLSPGSAGTASMSVEARYGTAQLSTSNLVPNPGFEQGGCGTSTPVVCDWVPEGGYMSRLGDPASGFSLGLDCGPLGCYADGFVQMVGVGAMAVLCVPIGPGIHPASAFAQTDPGASAAFTAAFFQTPDCTGPSAFDSLGGDGGGSLSGSLAAPVGTESARFWVGASVPCVDFCSLSAIFDDLDVESTVLPTPAITSVKPLGGPPGTSVDVRGLNFTGATSVTFAGTAATFTVDSDSELHAVVPSGATTGQISVTTAAGGAASKDVFTIEDVPAPTITSFAPTGGTVGTRVTITGTDLSGATGVAFYGYPASFTVDSPTSITAIVPSGARTGPLSVRTPYGTDETWSWFTFGVPPPRIDSFTPTSGPVGTSINIDGDFFAQATAVTIGGVAASFYVESNSEIHAIVPAGAASGPIAITAPSGTGTSSSSFTVPGSQDFSIAAAPSSLNIAQGASATSTIQTAVTSGSGQTVGLAAAGQPAGTAVSFSPASVSAGGSSTMSVDVGPTVAPGSYTITVTGTGTSGTHAAAVALTVSASDFSISSAPTALTAAQGETATSSIATARTSGAAQTVVLSAAGQPVATAVAFAPASITAGGSSTMTVNVGSATAPGTYTIVVTGTGASVTQTASVGLTVLPAPISDFSIEASPTGLSVAQGAAGTSTIKTAVTSGSAPAVSLSANGQPSGTTVAFSPASVSAGNSSTMTVTAGAATAPGTYTITVTGNAVTATHTATVALTVTAAPANAVANGGFETGNLAGWVPRAAGGAPLPAIVTSAHSGGYAARVGSTTGVTGSSKLQQTVTVPWGSSQLRFWYQPYCLDNADKIDMQIRTTDGATLAKVLTGCPTTGAWTSVSYTMSAYAGQSVVLWWQARDASQNPVSFLLDDVTLG